MKTCLQSTPYPVGEFIRFGRFFACKRGAYYRVNVLIPHDLNVNEEN